MAKTARKINKVEQAPKRLSPEDRRAAVMAAALELFMTKGYAATSLDEVVAKSGGSLSTVYQLFGNKEGLWKALIDQKCTAVTQPLRDAVDTDGLPRDVLRALGHRLVALQTSRDAGGAIRLILAEGSRFPELAATLFANGPDNSKQIVAGYLAAQVKKGRLTIDDTHLATEQFCSLICGDLLLRNACGAAIKLTPQDAERRIDAAVELFLLAYAATPAR